MAEIETAMQLRAMYLYWNRYNFLRPESFLELAYAYIKIVGNVFENKICDFALFFRLH